MIRETFYIIIMRFMHKFNWHYAPPIYPDGDTMLWCKWCGMSDVIKRRETRSQLIGNQAVKVQVCRDADRAILDTAAGRELVSLVAQQMRKEVS